MADGTPEPLLDGPRIRRLIVFCCGFVVLAMAVMLLYSSLLPALLVSGFLTYLLLPMVDRLAKRMPRWAAVALIVVGGVAVVVVGTALVVPVLYQQAVSLVQLAPAATNKVLSTWLPVVEKYVVQLGGDASDVRQLLQVNSLMSRVAAILQSGLAGAWKTGASVFGGLFHMVLVPVLTFFFLKDYHAFSRALGSIVPRDLALPVDRILARMDKTLRSVLKGQAIVAGILTVLYVIGFSVVGLQSAIAIGVVAGLCRLIPYADVIVGGALSTIVLLSNFTGWGQVLSVVLVFVVVQGLDGAFITPSVIGERVGLHPMLVITSVLAFGDWLGFWGVLLAIPVAAILKSLFTAALPYYHTSRAFHPRPRDETPK